MKKLLMTSLILLVCSIVIWFLFSGESKHISFSYDLSMGSAMLPSNSVARNEIINEIKARDFLSRVIDGREKYNGYRKVLYNLWRPEIKEVGSLIEISVPSRELNESFPEDLLLSLRSDLTEEIMSICSDRKALEEMGQMRR